LEGLVVVENLEKGVIFIIAATFFLLLGLEMLEFKLLEPGYSMLLSFICLGIGVYFVTKK